MRRGSQRVTRRINLGETAARIASNRCRDCGHEWTDKPMGFARILACPHCRSEYWQWRNFVDAHREPPADTASS